MFWDSGNIEIKAMRSYRNDTHTQNILYNLVLRVTSLGEKRN